MQANIECRFTLKCVRDMIITYTRCLMMMNCFNGMINCRKVFSLIFSWDHKHILNIMNLQHDTEFEPEIRRT